MTELLALDLAVRTGGGELPQALRLPAGWRAVQQVVNRWRVETDWWREPVRRDYFRCLLSDGGCVEVCRDLDTGAWQLVRRYD